VILGHEILGEVADLPADGPTDVEGRPLRIGDRVTFSILVACGQCDRCAAGMSQKCRKLFKFGHTCVEKDPSLSGGFAEYVHLPAGATIVRVPDELPDEVACSANCATATAAAGLRTVGLCAGESILIHGAGLLGLSAAAMARAKGASQVIVVDVNPDRLALARQFGATTTINSAESGERHLAETAAELTGGEGVDRAMEACGRPEVIPEGMEALRIGGAYVWIGSVWAGAVATVDVNQAIRKLIRINGLHNYLPADLRGAVDFLAKSWREFGFGQVVGRTMGLDELPEAFAVAATGEFLRVAVRP